LAAELKAARFLVCNERAFDNLAPPLITMKRAVLRFTLMLAFLSAPALAKAQTENVILITLDGVRTEEMFSGIDMAILKEINKKENIQEHPLYRKYWAPTAEERREKLMPFFWGALMKEHGSIGGNREKKSAAELSNRHRFSYPGYSELLTGTARDQLIRSNAKVQNPHPTVLEFLKKELGLTKAQVAAFCSWDVFEFIVENERGAIVVNAGFQPYEHPSSEIKLLNQLQMETSTPWDSVRHDAYTFRFAMEHLKTFHPRALYLALGETDDWGHDKRYDRVLFAMELADAYLRELWEFLQGHEQYRGKTTIMITTDHGRGNNEYSWPNHGAQIEGAQYIWIACISPESPARGEWENSPTVYLDQVAATLCRFLQLDYNKFAPEAGKPIEHLFQ
jgi:hypothetical protein